MTIVFVNAHCRKLRTKTNKVIHKHYHCCGTFPFIAKYGSYYGVCLISDTF